MRSYIVKLASNKYKEEHPSFKHDTSKYLAASLAGGGLLGPALMRNYGEADEDLQNSKLRAAGYGIVGALATGMPVRALTKGNLLATGLAGATGVALGNAYLNKKIREERARKKGR